MNLKNLDNIELSGIDTSDYPDFCDAYVSSATWVDNGSELTEDELDRLNYEHRDWVYDKIIEHLF